MGVPLAVPCPIPYFECQAAFLAEHLARPAEVRSRLCSPSAAASAAASAHLPHPCRPRPPSQAPMSSEAERDAWLRERMEAVGFEAGRPQDLHFTSAGGGSPWGYMRELLRAVHAARPPAEQEGASWVERPDCFARLETVESVYNDRGARRAQPS